MKTRKLGLGMIQKNMVMYEKNNEEIIKMKQNMDTPLWLITAKAFELGMKQLKSMPEDEIKSMFNSFDNEINKKPYSKRGIR